MKFSVKRKLHKSSLLLIAVAVAFVLSLLAAPAASISSNQCGSCHGTSYSQQIDLVEASSTVPSSLQVGQTVSVTVVLQNINNAPKNTLLSNVQVTLSSQSGRFSVNTPTYTIGNLASGSATASFQVTGVSAGTDQFVISASARNTHQNTPLFTDTYSPNPSITVTAGTGNPTPTSQPTTPPTTNPTSTPPEATPNPTPTPTSSSSANPTVTPSPTASAYSIPTPTPPPTATPDATAPTQTPEPTTEPTATPTASESHSNQLNSTMLYIHPPLAIAGYVFIFAFAALTIKMGIAPNKATKTTAVAAWALTALGLFTGMLWAQVAWGSYWSWDIKETLTLTLFLSLSAAQVAYFERKPQAAKWLMVATCILVVVTASSSFILAGLHSYL